MHRVLIGSIITTLLITAGVIVHEPLFGVGLARIDDIELLQEAYMQREGKYLQIIDGSQLPHYETGDLETKLGKRLPAGVNVHVYTTPEGQKGYWVEYKDAVGYHSIGFGTEAKERTYTLPNSATST